MSPMSGSIPAARTRRCARRIRNSPCPPTSTWRGRINSAGGSRYRCSPDRHGGDAGAVSRHLFPRLHSRSHRRQGGQSAGQPHRPAGGGEEHGADILRLWVATADVHADIAMSEDSFTQVVELYRRLRNTARFLLGNLYDFTTEQLCPPEELEELTAGCCTAAICWCAA